MFLPLPPSCLPPLSFLFSTLSSQGVTHVKEAFHILQMACDLNSTAGIC